MKHITIACTLLATMVGAVAAPRPLPWSEGTNKAARFEVNSSGKMTIVDDVAEKAIRVDVEFKPGTDFWAYPTLRFNSNESLADVEQIRFEIKAEQGKADAKYRFAYVMFGGEKSYFTMPAPKAEYQTVTINVADAVKDPAAARFIKIGMNPTDTKLTFHIRNLEFLTEKKGSFAFDAADAISLSAPGSVFLPNEALTFQLKPFAAVPSKWSLRNWKDEVIRQGEWPAAGKDALTLAALPNGYYKLEIASTDADFSGFRSFVVVPDPGKRPANPDLYFAMDSAQSWLARQDGRNARQPENSFEVVSEVARRAGLQMVRERLSWNATETAPGKIDWMQYKTNATLLADRGVKVSGMYHDAATWAKTNTEKLPGDLVATYNFAKRLTEDFKGQMTVWEFWNEQDIGFAPEAAWDYASAMKAAYLGFKAGNPDLPVAIGGYAITSPPYYDDIVMASETGEYFDIFNIHTYHPIHKYPEALKAIREHMKRHGIEDRPIWFTENGSNMEGSGRMDSYIPGLKMHSPEQEMLLSEFIPKMMINMQSLGVTRDFFFVLPPYNEGGGNKDWGLMRRDFTVKPGYAAFATLVDQLGTAKLEGEVALGEGLRGFLYGQKDGSKTLVYWSVSPIDTEGQQPNLTTENRLERSFALPKQKGKLKGVDLFGTPIEVDGAKVTATRFPTFLNQVTGLKLSVPFVAPKLTPLTAKPGMDKSIVFRTELSDDFMLFGTKDSVDVKKNDAKFKLQVWNLSDREKSGSVTLAGGTVKGLPPTITIPAFDKAEFELMLTPEFQNKFSGQLMIGGKFNGLEASKHVIPIRSLAMMSEQGRTVDMPQMVDPANWRKNAAGEMTITYDAADKAIAFRTLFKPEVDHWTYPEYVLQLPQESLKGALGIGFEVKVNKAAGVKQMLVMAVKGKLKEAGESIYLAVNKPGEQWEERFTQFPDGFDAGAVEQLRIGVNAQVDDITVSIRNVRIYYAP